MTDALGKHQKHGCVGSDEQQKKRTDLWGDACRLLQLRDPYEIVTLLGQLMLEQVPGEVFAALLPDAERTEYWLQREEATSETHGLSDFPEALGSACSIIPEALGDRPYLEVTSRSASPLRQTLISLGVDSILLFALVSDENTKGWALLGRTAPNISFDEPSRKRALDLLAMTNIALENAQIVQEMKATAEHASSFVANLSHELRTPLHVIIGYAEMLSDGEFGSQNQEQYDLTRRIAASAQEQLELVNTALEISRYEGNSETLPTPPVAVDVSKLLSELEAEVSLKRMKKSVRVRWTSDIVAPLITEPIKLKMILKNLIENAIKFTHEGTIDVIAKQEENHFVFEVRDTGVGIPAASQESIFDPFFQLDPHDSLLGGVGLGLYLVRTLIQALSGQIAVESEPGRGSVFRVVLPRN